MKCSWLQRVGIVIVLATALPTAGRSMLLDPASSGPLAIGLAPIDLRSEDPKAVPAEPSAKLSDVIARTVGELFPNYVQRVFEKSFDRPVTIVATGPINLTDRTLP